MNMLCVCAMCMSRYFVTSVQNIHITLWPIYQYINLQYGRCSYGAEVSETMHYLQTPVLVMPETSGDVHRTDCY